MYSQYLGFPMKQIICKSHKKPCCVVQTNTLQALCSKCLSKIQGGDLIDIDEYIASCMEQIKHSHVRINKNAKSIEKRLMYEKFIAKIDKIQKAKHEEEEKKVVNEGFISDQSYQILKKAQPILEKGDFDKLMALKEASQNLEKKLEKENKEKGQISFLKLQFLKYKSSDEILKYLIDGFELLLLKPQVIQDIISQCIVHKRMTSRCTTGSQNFKFIKKKNLGNDFAYKISNGGKKITRTNNNQHYSLCRVDKPIQLNKKINVKFKLTCLWDGGNFGLATQEYFQTSSRFKCKGSSIGGFCNSPVYLKNQNTKVGNFQNGQTIRFEVLQKENFKADIKIYTNEELTFQIEDEQFDGRLIPMASLYLKGAYIEII